MQLPLVTPCPSQSWEDLLKCKGGISRVLLTFSLSLCVNLASCVQLWHGQNSSAPCTLPAALSSQSRNSAGCFRIAEKKEKAPGWCLTCIHVSGPALKGDWGALSVGRTQTLHCCFTVLCYPTCTPMADTQLQWPGGQELCWKFLDEGIQFLCAGTALFAFIQGSYT